MEQLSTDTIIDLSNIKMCGFSYLAKLFQLHP